MARSALGVRIRYKGEVAAMPPANWTCVPYSDVGQAFEPDRHCQARKPDLRGDLMANETNDVATLAGGCFWCLEAVFEQLRGVEKVESGYAGGRSERPTYDDVCSGTTGHAEVVRVTFDPQAIAFREI